MLNIQRFVCNMFQENCYVVSDSSKECVIIDCGAFFNEEKKAISDYIDNNKLTPINLLCTHGHVDHNFGNKFIYDTFGLKPRVSLKDEQLMNNLNTQAEAFIGKVVDEKFPTIGKELSENETIKFGNHTLSIIPTPGHTPGSVFLYCSEESLAFSGDTLFQMSIGRTDLALGNFDDIMLSLAHIAKVLPPETTILPGHGSKTNMKDEIKYNPYLKHHD